MLAATLALIPVLIIEFDAAGRWGTFAIVASWVICGVFAFKLGAILAVAERKRVALRAHWLDVAIVVLTMPRPSCKANGTSGATAGVRSSRVGGLRPEEKERENARGSALVLAVIHAIGWRRYLECRWPRERYTTEPIPDHLVADLGIAPLVTKNLDAIAGMGVVQKRTGARARGKERLRRVRRGLSPAERRYLRLASSGHGASESAALVGRSRTQVTRALASARLVLGAETVPQAVAIAVSERKIQVKPLRERRIILREHEMKILRALALGLTYAQIERALFYARDSVRVELGRAIRRNGARNRTHLLALSIRAGVLNLAS